MKTFNITEDELQELVLIGYRRGLGDSSQNNTPGAWGKLKGTKSYEELYQMSKGDLEEFIKSRADIKLPSELFPKFRR